MTNVEIAAAFEEIADLLEVQGANQFRVRAYRNAARTIRELPEALKDIAADPSRKLTDLEGIGKDLAEKINTLLETGSLPMLQELLAEIPASVLDLLRVPGLGPKRAAILHRELKINTLDELREACESHRIRELKGFGEKIETAVLAGIDLASQAGQRMLWADADQFAQELLAHMRGCKAIAEIVAAGSYRRGKETIGDLDFLAVAADAAEAMDRLANWSGVAETIARGETKMSVRLSAGLQVDLRVVPAESFGAALQYFTGSKQHNIVLRTLAKERGLKINEYGVFRGDRLVAGRTEEEVYAALGLPCFPPELREARREFDWARQGPLPRLVELADIRGDLHTHSTWSDGTATIEQMALAAKARGLTYLAVTDHSKRATIAGGLDAAELRREWKEIDALNRRLDGIVVLKGVEVDILERGGLDLDDDLLAGADWVNASVHYGQNQSREQITRRVVDALANPCVSAFAHPTGRMLNKRRPYEIDLEAVMKAARAREDARIERPSAAIGLGRRGLCGGEGARRARGDLDRRASDRGPRGDALRRDPGPSRRVDERGRGEHAAVGSGAEDAATEKIAPSASHPLPSNRH